MPIQALGRFSVKSSSLDAVLLGQPSLAHLHKCSWRRRVSPCCCARISCPLLLRVLSDWMMWDRCATCRMTPSRSTSQRSVPKEICGTILGTRPNLNPEDRERRACVACLCILCVQCVRQASSETQIYSLCPSPKLRYGEIESPWLTEFHIDVEDAEKGAARTSVGSVGSAGPASPPHPPKADNHLVIPPTAGVATQKPKTVRRTLSSLWASSVCVRRVDGSIIDAFQEHSPDLFHECVCLWPHTVVQRALRCVGRWEATRTFSTAPFHPR